jgi:hypothetical protein
MTTKRWLLLFAALLLIAALAHLLLTRFHPGGATATVYHHNIPIQTIDLGRIDLPHSFTIQGEGGAYNVVLVESGQISIQSSSCPDQICVLQGPITDGARPIVCLPHRVVIQISRGQSDEADVITGG